MSGGPLPVLSGGTTLGIQRGALDVYLLALPLALLGKHIEAAVWGLAALGVIAVALTYVLGRRVGGPVVGLMAALFMAANPWLIAYDRKLWAHIQVAFSVLLLILAWDVVVRRRRWAAFWFPVVAALQMLAHVLAVLQALSWLGAFLVAPRRWWRRETGFGIVAAAGLMIPYAWALANRWLARGAATATFAPGIPGSVSIGARRAARRLAASVLPVHRRRHKQPGRVDRGVERRLASDGVSGDPGRPPDRRGRRSYRSLGARRSATPSAPAFCWRGRSARSWRSAWA